jgi:hypothetical protein
VSTQPPDGLRILALCAVIFALVMLYVTSAGDTPGVGGVAGVLGTLALVAGEALWSGRAWAFRASALLAMAHFLVLLVSPWAIDNAPFGLIAAVLSAVGVIPALIYIRRQMSLLSHAPRPTRVVVPGRVP